MDKGEADHFAGLLDCNTVLADAQDFGLINRPRLWWTRVDWSRTRTNPITGEAAEVVKEPEIPPPPP